MTRRYELKQRAESQAGTRTRIVEATVGLHEEVGPAHTTVTAIAERAGVQRLTVYRHFPDERTLYAACSTHWSLQHPAPDPTAWAAIADVEERLRTALREIYAFYASTEGMMEHLLRDIPELPALAEVASPFMGYWERVVDTLTRGWNVRGAARRRLRAALGHAVAFETWRSLVRRQELSQADAVELMVALARGAV
jgi:AcrR family transcriptional regulator